MNTDFAKLPAGAVALLIAMQTPTRHGMGVPVLLWGKPGVGKSSFINGLASETTEVVVLIASIHDPTDFSGLPFLQNGKMQYASPAWLEKFQGRENGVLFLDELTTAPPAVQAALLRVVCERMVGQHPLPASVRVLAAANPTSAMSGGWELSPPLLNRFCHLQWELPVANYLDALQGGSFPKAQLPHVAPQQHADLLPVWQAKVAGFLKTAPHLYETSPQPGQMAFASPRSWDNAIALMATADLLGYAPSADNPGSTIFADLLTGTVGIDVALPFVAYLQDLRLPEAAEVLATTPAQRAKMLKDITALPDNAVFVFGNILASHITRVAAPSSGITNAELTLLAINYFSCVKALYEQQRLDVILSSNKRVIAHDGASLGVRALAAAATVGADARKQVIDLLQAILGNEDMRAMGLLL